MPSAMRGMAASRRFTNFMLLFSCLAYQATRDFEAAVGSVGSIAREFFCTSIKSPRFGGASHLTTVFWLFMTSPEGGAREGRGLTCCSGIQPRGDGWQAQVSPLLWPDWCDGLICRRRCRAVRHSRLQ